MLESGVLEMKDDYDFKDEVTNSENKENENKKLKTNVSFFQIKTQNIELNQRKYFLCFIDFYIDYNLLISLNIKLVIDYVK